MIGAGLRLVVPEHKKNRTSRGLSTLNVTSRRDGRSGQTVVDRASKVTRAHSKLNNTNKRVRRGNTANGNVRIGVGTSDRNNLQALKLGKNVEKRTVLAGENVQVSFVGLQFSE